jgi:predicted transcriptional regulator
MNTSALSLPDNVISNVPKAPAADPANTKQARSQALLGRVQSVAFFEGFNPRAYDTYWERLKYPADYLDNVGIEKVAELVHHGFSNNEIARLLEISSMVFRRWIEGNAAHEAEIKRAREYVGDERAYEALRVLEKADPKNLDRAKAISSVSMQHAQALNRSQWGKQVQIDQTINATMSYVIDLGATRGNGLPPIEHKPKAAKVVGSSQAGMASSDLTLSLCIPDGVEP